MTQTAATPITAPSTTYVARAAPPGGATAGIGKTGADPTNAMRTPVAAAAASATGMSERGRYSKSSSSTASSTAETGLPKVAAMPAAAPAASSVLRSSAVRASSWPISEPSAPPVAMIGPSAPNGPPVPIAIAAESGLRNVIRGGDAALVEEHLLHRLGDAVAADGLRAVARHEPDDERRR